MTMELGIELLMEKARTKDILSNDRKLNKFGNNEYIKMEINKSGFNGIVPVASILKMLKYYRGGHLVFYIRPVIDITNGEQMMLTHTISYNNAYGKERNFVAANHCQYGTNFLVFDIKVCKADCLLRQLDDV